MARGRKAKTWIDVYRDTETTYAPNTIGAVGLVGISGVPSTDTPFVRVVEGLMNLQSTNPPSSAAEAVCQIRLRYVCSDFLSRKFNISPPWPLADDMGKPLKGRTLKYIRMLGAEATALFNLVSDVFAVRPVASFGSAAEVWAAMMIENLPRSKFFDSEEFEGLTKRKAVDDYRGKSAALAERRNPYPIDTAHHAFFQAACLFAQKATGRKEDRMSIYARSYLPYLRVRAELVDYIDSKKSRTKMLKNKKLQI